MGNGDQMSDGRQDKIAHLGFIQNVISRMGSNSFLLKGWSVTLVAALFVLSSKDSNTNFVFIALLPAIVFWILDGFFLSTEKQFRTYYDKVGKDEIISDQFIIDLTLLNDGKKLTVKQKIISWLKAAFSFTLVAFHGIILITVIGVMIKFSSTSKTTTTQKQEEINPKACVSTTLQKYK